MSKFSEEFCDTYGKVGRLKKITKELKESNSFNKKMKQSNINLTKITQGKLGRTL